MRTPPLLIQISPAPRRGRRPPKKWPPRLRCRFSRLKFKEAQRKVGRRADPFFFFSACGERLPCGRPSGHKLVWALPRGLPAKANLSFVLFPFPLPPCSFLLSLLFSFPPLLCSSPPLLLSPPLLAPSPLFCFPFPFSLPSFGLAPRRPSVCPAPHHRLRIKDGGRTCASACACPCVLQCCM